MLRTITTSMLAISFLFLGLFTITLQAKSIKVGAVFPMTGPIATYGQESMNGIKMALREINKKGIKGHKLELILEDNKGEPMDSANAVTKLIKVDGVKAILGSVASSNTLAQAPIAQKAGVPLLTPASTNEKVTQTGEFVSRICFTDAFQGVVMAKFARETLKKKKAAIIIDASSDYSKGLAEVFERKFTEMGGTVLKKKYAYQQKDTDFRSLLKRVQRAKPDMVFLPGYYTEVGLILNQAKQMRISLPFLGGDGWDSAKLPELAGNIALKGNYISSHFSAGDTDPLVQSFVKNYTKEFKSSPGAMAALGYDAVLVLADALRRAKNVNDPKSIKDAINSTRNFQGITGNITLNSGRNAVKSAVVLETTKKGNVFAQKVNP